MHLTTRTMITLSLPEWKPFFSCLTPQNTGPSFLFVAVLPVRFLNCRACLFPVLSFFFPSVHNQLFSLNSWVGLRSLPGCFSSQYPLVPSSSSQCTRLSSYRATRLSVTLFLGFSFLQVFSTPRPAATNLTVFFPEGRIRFSVF